MHDDVLFNGPGVWIGLAIVLVGALVALGMLVDSFREKRRGDARQVSLTVARIVAIVYLAIVGLAAYIKVSGELSHLAGGTVLALILFWFVLLVASVSYLLTFVFDRRSE